MYGASCGGKTHRQPVKVRVGAQLLDVADRVDVPLHEVPAEAAVGAQRTLEIHERARAPARRAS